MSNRCGMFIKDQEILPYRKYFYILGFLCLLISIIEFGVGGAVWNYFTNYVVYRYVQGGAWWGVIGVFLAGLSCFFVINKKLAGLTCFVSILGFITSFIGR